MMDQSEKVAIVDECIAEMSPQGQTAVILWIDAICREMGDRARLRGQRPNFGVASAKELLFEALRKGLI